MENPKDGINWIGRRVRKANGYKYQTTPENRVWDNYSLDKDLKVKWAKLCRDKEWNKSEIFRTVVEKIVENGNIDWIDENKFKGNKT